VTDFMIGLLSGMLLLLIGQRISVSYQARDQGQRVIIDVAEKYHVLVHARKSSGAHGLLHSGVCRLRNAEDIEDAILRIIDLGHTDPLMTIRDQLAKTDIHRFFRVIQTYRLNPLQGDDLTKAFQILSAE
jgi:hypothetical protein